MNNVKPLMPSWEQAATVSISLIVAVAAAWFVWQPHDAVDPARMQAFAGAIASVAGSLFGFVLAAMSILVSSDRLLIRNMHKTGHYRRLHQDMVRAAALLCVTFLCAVGMVVLPAGWLFWTARVTTGIAVLAASMTAFTGRRFMRVINTLGRSDR